MRLHRTGGLDADRSGPAFGRATSIGPGNVPSGAKVIGKDVRLTWTATTLTNGAAVSGYLVRRYNALTSAESTVATNCSGTVAALTCTENNVAKGSWQYTITPTRGNWRGTLSTKSSAVDVENPAPQNLGWASVLALAPRS